MPPPTASEHSPGFETLDREQTSIPLTVEGRFPSWLAGTLLRTGPALFETGTDRYRHWFDGLAMLHRFAFAEATVSYTCRFVDSPAYREARETGRIAYSEFATDPCRSLFQRVVTAFQPPQTGANPNVNVHRFGADFVAVSETPLPVVFDPVTLETWGVQAPAPGQLTVAHPHRSPHSGDLVSYATHFGPLTTYRLYTRSGSRAQPRVTGTIRTWRPSYMHSFAITERYAVLVEFPFVAIPIAFPLSGRPFIENYRWVPERGTRFLVIDLETGRLCRTYRTVPFFAFHHVNAFERGDDLVIDLCAYDDAEIVRALYLDRVRQADPRLPAATLRRYVLPANGGDVRAERLHGANLELPRIDYERHNGRPYRYVYGVGIEGGFYDRIVKVDVERHESAVWSQPGTYPGEPVFVRTPGSSREDDGVLLSVVLDPVRGTSFLLVLDAVTLTETARAWVPHSIPFGFHGQFFATDQQESTVDG